METIKELIDMADLEQARGFKFLEEGKLEQYVKSYNLVNELNFRIELKK